MHLAKKTDLIVIDSTDAYGSKPDGTQVLANLDGLIVSIEMCYDMSPVNGRVSQHQRTQVSRTPAACTLADPG